MSNSGDDKGLAARRAALGLLTAVTGEGRLMSELLPGGLEGLAPEDRARAQRLATSTLRWMDRADRALGPFLRQRPPEEALNALRLGTVELQVDRSAPHGVVDCAVRLMAEDPGTKRLSGLVNAVLRKVAKMPAEAWEALPVPRLPKKLRASVQKAYGKEAVAAIEAAHLAGAPLDLTFKDGAEAWAAAQGAVVLPTGSVRVSGAPQVTGLPGYAEGNWWVQDAAAAVPARVLGVRPGERVLDLCAAPGGKTMQLAAEGAKVTAVDSSESRMGRVRENLSRTGLTAELVVADALEWTPERPFDAVLLDAPCSATGTIRRHPDLPVAKAKVDFSGLFALQAQLIDRAVAMLRPGGRLVYCTCSLLPEEGEAQVVSALERHDRLALEPGAFDLPGIDPDWRVKQGLRLRPDYWPELGGMDGFFIAALRKAA